MRVIEPFATSLRRGTPLVWATGAGDGLAAITGAGAPAFLAWTILNPLSRSLAVSRSRTRGFRDPSTTAMRRVSPRLAVAMML